MGGGGFSMETEDSLLDDHILAIAREERGRDRPRVCFIPTASGDAVGYIAKFYSALARKTEAAHLALFERIVDDIDAFLLEQDVIYVGGGNTANMLAVWRVHGVDRALRRAWEAGVILTGLSAGSICWFEGGTTDSFGMGLTGLTDGARVPAGQPLAALRRRDRAATDLPRAGRRTGRCPTGMRRTTEPRWCLPVRTWSRPSVRALAPGRTGSSGRRAEAPSSGSCRRATWAVGLRVGRHVLRLGVPGRDGPDGVGPFDRGLTAAGGLDGRGPAGRHEARR